MGVDEPEVVDAVRHPEVDKPDRDHDGQRLAEKGRLVVAYLTEGTRATVKTVMWEGRGDRSEGPMTHIPNKPSNRVFIEKLLLWGCTQGRKRSDYVQFRAPNGQILEVRPAGFSKGNSARTLIEAYRAVGATAEEFWARTVKVRPPRERVHATPSDLTFPRAVEPVEAPPEPAPERSEAKVPSIDSLGGRVFAYHRAHPNEVCNLDRMAADLGVEKRRVKQACYYLAQDGLLQKVATNQYRYKVWGESEAHKAKAHADLAYICDPANRLPGKKPRGVGPPKPHRSTPLNPGTARNGMTRLVLDYYKARAGQYLRMPDVAAELGIAVKSVNNAVNHLARADMLQQRSRGVYCYPGEVDTAADPLERLDAIQARLDEPEAAVPVPAPDPEPTPPTPAAPKPIPAEPVPVIGRTSYASVDDEIDALLELLVPGGIKARHLTVAASWVVATRDLLRVVRER